MRINRHKKTSLEAGSFIKSVASVFLFPLRGISTPHNNYHVKTGIKVNSW
tara:strand:- start:676 stop:825 length:150 start_codon:yes stop_codon:yes gene_type:complete